MLVPQLYSPPTASHVIDIIRMFPMAVFLTNGRRVPHATNLPAILVDDDIEEIREGTALFGHMNKRNPHWATLSDGDHARLIFNGPGTYISPLHYRTDTAAPTWNFVTVHLTGEIRRMATTEETLHVARATSARLESIFGGGWDQADSLEYHRSIVGGVGAFKFIVDTTEAMFKLSQEKTPEVQQWIIDSFLTEPAGSSRDQIAQAMLRSGLGTSAAQPGSTSPSSQPSIIN